MTEQAKKTKRRTPKQLRSESTVTCILEAAAQVLLREGYARSTTNRIAERAGISVGSLYQYFDDKDAIFDGLLKDYFAHLVASVAEDPIDPSLPLEETFRRLASIGLRVWPKGPEVLHHLEQVPRAAVRARARRAKRELLTVLRTVVEAPQADLRVHGGDLDTALSLVVGAAEGMFYDLPPGADPEIIAREVATMFARYLSRAS
jgi:AcrR family transcriptional regulator